MTVLQPNTGAPVSAPDGLPGAATAERPSVPAADRGAGFWRRFRRQRVALVSLGFLLVVIVCCFAASLVAPYGAEETDFGAAGSGPSLHHLLGTDNLGRDVLSRLLYGGQHTMVAVTLALLVACALGTPLGVAAGYFGGRTDRVLTTFADGLMALPAMILLLAVLAVFPHNTIAAMITFGVLVSAGLGRVVRASVLGVRSEQYVDAARVGGLSEPQIIRYHVLSKVVAPVVVQLTLLAGVALITETGLGYLGLGPQPPTPTWGSLVGDASSVIQQQPWLLVPTGGTVGLTVLAFGLLGDGIRDALTERWSPSGRAPRISTVPASETPEHEAPPPLRADAALQVRDLAVAFAGEGGQQVVVRNVSFSVAPGETVALVGESGCGKTVTSRAIMGLLPAGGSIVRGEILLGRTPIAAAGSRPSADVRGRRIAMISQEPMVALDPSLRIGRLLADSVRRHTGAGRADARRRAEELLALVGIPEPRAALRRYPHELSGGMAQRVAIA
ncbi:MAG TPA: ABC transporter permease subunit, partial [Jatrophihabitans sp.]|nr:ABC transporter permease subunit [Jatrophihabitans sp.]